MPVPMMKKAHEETGISMQTLEKYWAEAKAIAFKDGNSENWGLVAKIFQNKVKKHSNMSESFSDLFYK